MFVTIGSSALLVVVSLFFLKQRKIYKQLSLEYTEKESAFAPIKNAEAREGSVAESYADLQKSYAHRLKDLKTQESLISRYDIGVGTVDTIPYKCISQTRNLEETESEYAFVKESLKQMVKDKAACICSMGNDVVVNGKKSEAKKLFNREIKLRLRCLDNEVKSAIVHANWNNINRLCDRVKSTYNEINASGDIVKTKIQPRYLDLKLRELKLSYELNQLKIDIKEEEREQRRIEREAEREGAKIQAAAEKAKSDREKMEVLVSHELANLDRESQAQIALLEEHQRELEELKAKEQRAISMAQITRSGYVYVISNEMSFGRGICKIGMTRRVNPNDRVKELGDASVPDFFTVHGYIFSDDAPKLEKTLHNIFAENRVNMVNNRKEFFFVEPNQVLEAIKKYDDSLVISTNENT